MKYLIGLIFLAIVIESMIVAGQQRFSNNNNDNEYDKPVNADDDDDDDGIVTATPTIVRRPSSNFNGRKVLKVKKEKNLQESLPAVNRLNRTPYSSEDNSVSASSSKNSFTVNNYDDNDDYSRRRARFLFRQRVGK